MIETDTGQRVSQLTITSMGHHVEFTLKLYEQLYFSKLDSEGCGIPLPKLRSRTEIIISLIFSLFIIQF